MSEVLEKADLLEQAEGLLRAARAAGADGAVTSLGVGTSISVGRRLGKIEETERAEARGLGLKVYVGRRHASVSAGSIDPAAFARLAEQAVAMARVVPEDPYDEIPEAPPALDAGFLDLDDAEEPTMEVLIGRAGAAEEAALAVTGITNSEGGSASWGRNFSVLANSRGLAGQGFGGPSFSGQYARSSHGVSASVIAGAGTEMQRDYDYASAVHGEDLEDPAVLGRRAAEQALARMNPKRPKTAKLPVVFHPRVAGGMVGHLISAISGASIARGTSFLKDSLGQKLFKSGVDIVDDPLRKRGRRSRIFDGEGQRGARRKLIDDGVLTTWLLDTRTANQLGMKSTAHAGGASNLYMAAGTLSPAALIADIGEGLFITELIGMGVNGITGDYSRGAAGFMIRDGAIAEPVAEFTIAGNLKAMFAELTPADDLVFRRGTDVPTIRIDGMTMAGI